MEQKKYPADSPESKRMNKTIILFNPSSGKGRAGSRRPELEQRLHSLGIPYELIVTRSEDHLKILTAEKAPLCSILAGAGGDSTFNIMINVMMQKKPSAPLAMFGLGSSNDVPKAFGLDSLENACTALKKGMIHTIDLGAVAQKGNILNYFIGQANIGLGALVAEYVEKLSKRKPHWGRRQTLAGILAVFDTYRKQKIPFPLEVEALDAHECGRYLTAIFNNTRYWATGKTLNPESHPDDGRLDCCLIKECSLARLARLYGLAGQERLGDAEEITFLQSKSFKVSGTRPFTVQADGEILGGVSQPSPFNRMEFKIIPQVLDIIY